MFSTAADSRLKRGGASPKVNQRVSLAPGHMPRAQAAPFSAGQCLCGNLAITLTTQVLPTPGRQSHRTEAKDTRQKGGRGGQGEGSKCLLTCLQQLLSISSMKPGQRPWHQVSALDDRYPTAQEGGGNIRGHSHSHLPRLEKALNNMLPRHSCCSLGPGQATTVVTADLG